MQPWRGPDGRKDRQRQNKASPSHTIPTLWFGDLLSPCEVSRGEGTSAAGNEHSAKLGVVVEGIGVTSSSARAAPSTMFALGTLWS